MNTVSPWAAILVTAGVTFASRALGVALSGRIAKDSAVFEWLTCVTHALLAALIARMLALPIGPLGATTLWDRGLAVGLGLAVFFLTKRNLLAGIAAGVSALVWLTW